MIGGKKVDILSLRRLIEQRGQVVQFYIIKDENELVLYLLLISSPLESRSLKIEMKSPKTISEAI